MRTIKKSKQTKGKMARQLVYVCIHTLLICLAWSMVLKTVAVALDRTVDLTDVLVFAGAAFGGELLMLLCKRIFSKDKEETE